MSRKKPQIVLLHGLFGSPLGLADITKDLQKAGYDVFVPAVPPFAGSEKTWTQQHNSAPEGTSLNELYATYFRDYFARHHINHPVLIGHSMGTLVATSILQYHPELLNEKVILLSPISKTPNPLIAKVSILSAYLPPKFVDWITTRFLIVARGRKAFREIIDQVHRCTLDRRPQRHYVKEATQFSASSTITDNLNQIVPTDQHFQIFLLPGEHDHLVPTAATRQAATALNQHPNFTCKYDSLPDTGHLHNYEKPRETVTAIIDFLEH